MLLIAFVKADEVALQPAESELAKLPDSVQQPEPPKKKVRGPKGPNPLSVKKKRPAVPRPAQPNLKPKPTPIGYKRKHEDDLDVVEVSTETNQAPMASGGRKRKRRRKVNTELSADHDVS